VMAEHIIRCRTRIMKVRRDEIYGSVVGLCPTPRDFLRHGSGVR
jgi:hypothetical protein